MKIFIENRLIKYFILLLSLIIWTSVSLIWIAGILLNNLLGIYIIVGLIYFLFVRLILKIDWKWTIPVGYIFATVAITLTIGLIDYGLFVYPNEMVREIRPAFIPLFTKFSWIKNEYDLNDFIFILRILINGLITIVLFELFYRLKKRNKK
jgi:hypothetical protein